MTAALIFDTPGCDTNLLSEKTFAGSGRDDRPDTFGLCRPSPRPATGSAASGCAARRVRRTPGSPAAARADRGQPHRSGLRPRASGNHLAHDLLNPQGSKAMNIRAAVEAVAGDLAVPVATVIPVCLAENRTYNVDDALWAALLDQQDEAIKGRFLRCLNQRIRETKTGYCCVGN